MYAREGDLLQFILTGRNEDYEIPYTYCICPIDINELGEDVFEIDLRDNETPAYISRDFHRFNVIHSSTPNLKIVHSEYTAYLDRPQSSLFIFGEEPDEDNT